MKEEDGMGRCKEEGWTWRCCWYMYAGSEETEGPQTEVKGAAVYNPSTGQHR